MEIMLGKIALELCYFEVTEIGYIIDTSNIIIIVTRVTII